MLHFLFYLMTLNDADTDWTFIKNGKFFKFTDKTKKNVDQSTFFLVLKKCFHKSRNSTFHLSFDQQHRTFMLNNGFFFEWNKKYFCITQMVFFVVAGVGVCWRFDIGTSPSSSSSRPRLFVGYNIGGKGKPAMFFR